MDKPATTSFTTDEKQDLLFLLTHVRDGGVSLSIVAEATGINYKSFMNKVTSLINEVVRLEGNNRNRFTKADYLAIKEWWGDYRQKMYSVE